MNDQINRLPPQDLDAERALLGSILLANNTADEVDGLITSQSFYLEPHGKIYAAIRRIIDQEGKADPVTIANELEKRGELEEIGGHVYLIRVLESVPHAAHAKYYANIVRDKATARSVIYACTDILRDAYSGEFGSQELLERAGNALMGLNERNTSGEMRLIALDSDALLDELATVDRPGVPLGFPGIDELVRATPGRLIVEAAPPGVGKSAHAIQMAMNVSKQGPVIVCSVEMTAREQELRMLQIAMKRTEDDIREMAQGENPSEVVEHVNRVMSLPIFINDSGDQTVASIAAQSRVIQRKYGLRLLIVDFLQMLAGANKKDTPEQQISQIARQLKLLAKSLDVPILALAAVNREQDKRPDKKPRMSDLRGSGGIESNADVVMFLDRPALWDSEDHQPSEAVLTVVKNRGGRLGVVPLRWEGEKFTFSSAAPPQADDFDPVSCWDESDTRNPANWFRS